MMERNRKQLIINADDFGMHSSVNSGIIKAHRKGVLTSTSLMATGKAFDDAVRQSKLHPDLGIGVHLVLAGDNPVSMPEAIPSLVDSRGRLYASYISFVKAFLMRRIKPKDVETECRAQIEAILHANISVSHIDGHQHLHVLPGIIEIVIKLAKQFGIPWIRSPLDTLIPSPGFGNRALYFFARRARRKIIASGLYTGDFFLGTAYSGRLTEENLLAMITALRPGISEIMCHPGEGIVEGEDTQTRRSIDRRQELEALLSPRVKKALQNNGIQLTNYQKLSAPSITPHPE